jgi:hypothetical protein
MITPEQIKNLKEGDPVFVRGKFKSVDDDGDFWIETGNCYRCYDPLCVSLPSEHGTSLSRRSSVGAETEVPTPKHDPTRFFKKGDKAEVVERNGRTPTCFPVGRIKVGDIVTVAENEAGDVFIKVLTKEGHKMMVPWFMLELVTPVEELEPYKLIDSPNTYNIVRDSAMVMTIHKKSHPNAKAAAEAECARLNAEYRKEQE